MKIVLAEKVSPATVAVFASARLEGSAHDQIRTGWPQNWPMPMRWWFALPCRWMRRCWTQRPSCA